MTVAAAAILAAVTLAGEAAPPVAADSTAVKLVEGVPFIAQDPQRCGPASLAMVMQFHGVTVEEPEVAAATHSAALGGTLITDLAAFARSRSLTAEVSQRRPEDLKAAVNRGEPVILLVDVGYGPISRGHYLVLHGYDPGRGRFLVHSGRDSSRWVGESRLLRQWQKAGALALRVTRS
jgi:ABC-type bacteriocin/lantibiotic exporter with double-glycine peptidase domain